MGQRSGLARGCEGVCVNVWSEAVGQRSGLARGCEGVCV